MIAHLRTLTIPPGRAGDCPDCGRVETFRERCPFCTGEVLIPGGVPKHVARLPFMRVLRRLGELPRRRVAK